MEVRPSDVRGVLGLDEAFLGDSGLFKKLGIQGHMSIDLDERRLDAEARRDVRHAEHLRRSGG